MGLYGTLVLVLGCSQSQARSRTLGQPPLCRSWTWPREASLLAPGVCWGQVGRGETGGRVGLRERVVVEDDVGEVVPVVGPAAGV